MLADLLINYVCTTVYLCTLMHLRYVIQGTFSPMMFYFIGYAFTQIPCSYLMDKYNVYCVASICAIANGIISFFLIDYVIHENYGLIYKLLSLSFGILSAPAFLCTCSIFLYSPRPKHINIPNILSLLMTVGFSIIGSQSIFLGDLIDQAQPFVLLAVGCGFGAYYIAQRKGKVKGVITKCAATSKGSIPFSELFSLSFIMIFISVATSGFLIYTYTGILYPQLLKKQLGRSFNNSAYQSLHKLGFATSFILPLLYSSLSLPLLVTSFGAVTGLVLASKAMITYSAAACYIIPLIVVGLLNAEGTRFTLLITENKSHKTFRSSLINTAHLFFGMVGVAAIKKVAEHTHLPVNTLAYYGAAIAAIIALITSLIGYYSSVKSLAPTSSHPSGDKPKYNKPDNSYNRFRR